MQPGEKTSLSLESTSASSDNPKPPPQLLDSYVNENMVITVVYSSVIQHQQSCSSRGEIPGLVCPSAHSDCRKLGQRDARRSWLSSPASRQGPEHNPGEKSLGVSTQGKKHAWDTFWVCSWGGVLSYTACGCPKQCPGAEWPFRLGLCRVPGRSAHRFKEKEWKRE